MLDSSLDLAKKLAAERQLGPEDYYYLGFHFSEQLHAARDFGGRLLQHVVKKHPRTDWAKQARNKLGAEGLLT